MRILQGLVFPSFQDFSASLSDSLCFRLSHAPLVEEKRECLNSQPRAYIDLLENEISHRMWLCARPAAHLHAIQLAPFISAVQSRGSAWLLPVACCLLPGGLSHSTGRLKNPKGMASKTSEMAARSTTCVSLVNPALVPSSLPCPSFCVPGVFCRGAFPLPSCWRPCRLPSFSWTAPRSVNPARAARVDRKTYFNMSQPCAAIVSEREARERSWLYPEETAWKNDREAEKLVKLAICRGLSNSLYSVHHFPPCARAPHS